MKPLYAPANVGKNKLVNKVRSDYRKKQMATFEERLATYTATLRPDDPRPLWAKLSYPTLYDGFLAFFQYEYNSMNLKLLADALQLDRSFMMRRLKEWAVRPVMQRKYYDEDGAPVIPYLNDLIMLCTSLYGFNMGIRKVRIECSTEGSTCNVLLPAVEQPPVILNYHHPLYTPGDPKEHTATFVVKFRGCTNYDEFEKQYPRHAAGILVLRELAGKRRISNDHIEEGNKFA